jgi:ubiquinone/menaquinone biosynthesis C-methylase UbiE
MSRELTSDLDVLERLAPPAGRDIVDVGCGPGVLARELARAGARVVGIEISEQQLAAARTADRAHEPADSGDAAKAGQAVGVKPRYLVGRAQVLPLADASMDLAIFMRTLHHIPPHDLVQALREARRVLRPGGALYVAEPLTEGSHFELTSLVEDETEVRAAAQRALAEAAVAGLDRTASVEYEVRARLAGVDAFRARTLAVDPTREEIFHVRREEIAAAFARLGEPGSAPGERWFSQPMRADVLRPVGA